MRKLALLCHLVLVLPLWAEPNPPQRVRLVGPNVLQRGSRQIIYVEGLFDSKDWKVLAPDQFTVRVTGAAKLVEDPAGTPTNPFEVRCDDVGRGEATVEVKAAGQATAATVAVGDVKPTGAVEITVNPATASHRFAGLGAGVLFYDNQFDISPGNDIYDWCFRDVRATFLHVLIRPDCEKVNDNDDWKTLDLTKFDFRSLERPFRIIRKALERDPGLQIYASLYSPPPWLKTNNSTGGQGTLKDGLRPRQELAEYVYAYLKHARRERIPVHYLSLFNEPDWPHTQDGMHFADFGTLAETFYECTKALDTLIAADAELKKPPVYIFPDVLGAGSITRSPKHAARLLAQPRLLQRVGVWGVHDYWNQAGTTYWRDRYRELRAVAKGKPVWMTEWAQRERRGDLASGVEYGATMLNALRLGAETWMAFEWCHPSGNQSGLISTDWGAKAPRARYWRSKAYHVFRQFANASPAGAKVLATTARWKGTSQGKGRGVEYLALRDGNDVILHLMNTEPVPVNYRVAVTGSYAKAEGWLTTPLADRTAAGSDAVTLGRQGVSGVVPGHALLSVVLRRDAGRK